MEPYKILSIGMIVCGVIALAIYFKNRKKNDNDIDRLG